MRLFARAIRRIAPLLPALVLGAGMARAALVAHDDFDAYSADAALQGLAGGTGWIAPWTGATGVTISDSPIHYVLDAALLGGGHSLKIAADSNVALSRLVAPDTSGQPYFVSFIFRPEGGAPDASVTGNVFAGWQATDSAPDVANDNIGFLGASGKAGARVDNLSSSFVTPLKYGQTYFFVIQYAGWNGSAYTSTRVWLNPTSSDQATADANITQVRTETGGGSSGFLGLRVRTTGLVAASAHYLVDELRIGRSWTDVVSPPPGYVPPTHPDPQAQLVVFGDSLSSGGRAGVPSTGPAPTSTNGGYLRQTWIQQAAPEAGFGTLVNYYEPGGTNYAVGGDTTVGMVVQIDRYLNDVLATANPAALYVLWCGGNDIGHTVEAMADGATIFNIGSRLAGLNAATTAAAEDAVDRMQAQLRRLALTGGKTFVWVNLPDLSQTPAVDYYVETYAFGLSSVRSTMATALRNASDTFNARMGPAIAALQAEFPAIAIHVMDAHSQFADIVARKEAYGFTNVTESSTTSNDYLFYDNVHPTSHGHYEISRLALDFMEARNLLPDSGPSTPVPNPTGLAAVESIPGLVAFWDFAEPSGSPRVSRVGAHALADGNSTAPVGRASDGPLSGYSARFDSTDQWLALPNSALGALDIAGPGAQVTVVAWVLRATENNSFIAGIWQEDDNDPRRQYGLFVDLPVYGGTDNVCGHVSLTGGASPGIPYSRDYSANLTPVRNQRWHTVAFTFDGAQARSWLDARFESRPAYTEPAAPNGQGLTYSKNPYNFPAGIGSNGGDFTVGAVRLTTGMHNQFQGRIGGVAVFNRALSPAELLRLHAAALAPAADGTVRAASFAFYNPSGAKATLGSVAWRGFKNTTTEWTTSIADGWIIPQNTGLDGEGGFLAKNSLGEAGVAWTDSAPAVPSSALARVEFTLNNALAADSVHLVARIGGQWFITKNAWRMSADGGTAANWGTVSERKTFAWTRAAASWEGLAFDETAKIWTRTGALAADLPDASLEAVGFWQPANLGTLRIDDLELHVHRAEVLASTPPPVPAPVEIWRAVHFDARQLAAPGVSGHAADPDGDGRPNLIEYALGSEPLESDAALNAPVISTEADRLRLDCVIPADRDDLAYVVEWSSDLVNWYSSSEYVVAAAPVPVSGGSLLVARSVASISALPRQFLRLRVTLAAP